MLKMKTRVFLWLIFLVLVSAAVKASPLQCRAAPGGCGGNEVEFLRLDSWSNSHAGIPGSGYGSYGICCSNLPSDSGVGYGYPYTSVIVKLDTDTNSHVWMPWQSAPISVVVGSAAGLFCEQAGSGECGSYGEAIVYEAYDTSNSNAGAPGTNLGNILCCWKTCEAADDIVSECAQDSDCCGSGSGLTYCSVGVGEGYPGKDLKTSDPSPNNPHCCPAGLYWEPNPAVGSPRCADIRPCNQLVP